MARADETLERLRAALDRGDWAPGARLPAERSLAEALGAGRGTLRKALEALEREGRIRRHVGQGTFVADAAAVAALRLEAAPTPADVMETRLMLEPAVAAAAALRARPVHIETLQALLAGAEGGWREWEHSDDRFHSAVAAASGNPLLVALLETLHGMRRRDDWSKLRRHSHTPPRRRAFLRHHSAIADAIARRDAAAAAAAMRTHLRAVQAAMLEDAEEAGDAAAAVAAAEAAAARAPLRSERDAEPAGPASA